MTVVGLVVQQHDGTVLFQNVREYLSIEKAHLAAKAFRNQISSYDDTSIKKGGFQHLTGSIVVLNMYRVYYMILNEIFILAISQANDNPFEGPLYLSRAKRVLSTASKEFIPSQITKKYMDISFSLERVLFGEDGLEVLTQKVSSPHQLFNPFQAHHHHHQSTIGIGNIVSSTPVTPIPITIGGRIVDNTFSFSNSSNNQQNNNNNNNMYISAPSTLSTMLSNNIINNNNNSLNNSRDSGGNNSLNNSKDNNIANNSSNSLLSSSTSNGNLSTMVSSSSLAYNNISNSLINNHQNDTDLDYNILQLESLLNLENFQIPDKIFTQPNQLPKVDKHIYDPPQTIKWGNPSIQSNSASSTRLTNRIMFTLRHPNAAKEAKEKEIKDQQEKELKEQQEINNMNASNNSNNSSSSTSSSCGGNNSQHNSQNTINNGAGSASNKSSPSTSPLSSSYNNNPSPSSPETSSMDFSSADIKSDEELPETPKRKFSLSMGTMHKQPQQQNNNSNNNNSNNNNNSSLKSSNNNNSIAPPPPVPLANKKMNFLNF